MGAPCAPPSSTKPLASSEKSPEVALTPGVQPAHFAHDHTAVRLLHQRLAAATSPGAK